jgi:hypothetical protein
MSTRLVHRLLAGRRGPTRGEKDDLFAAVMREVAPPRRPRWSAPALAVLGAAAALLLAPWLVRRDDAPPALVARGDAGAATFSAFCAGGPCRPGDTLLLEVAPADWPHFAAFARRDDGTVIWYSPTDDGASAVATSGVLASGIVLDDVHRPGTYRIYGVFSRAALDRVAIRARFQPGSDQTASAGPDTAVVVRAVVIE